jgi:recombination protein RecA
MNKQELISKLADSVKKKFQSHPDDIGIGLSSLPSVKRWVSTGCPPLDVILGGGIPLGRIVEIFGEESHGKSALGESIIASVQKNKGVGILLDTEYSFEEDKATRWGINKNDLVYFQPSSMEDCFDTLETIVDQVSGSEFPVVVVWDTVAATPTKAELDAAFTDDTPARQARRMSQALRRLNQKIAKTKIGCVFLNQTRENISISWGDKKTTAGGKALKFYASVRVEIRQIEKLKTGEIVTGIKCVARTVKNKIAEPFKDCRVIISFKEGVQAVESLLETLTHSGIVKKSGGHLVFKEERFTSEGLKDALEQNPDLQKLLAEEFRNAIFI